MGGKINPFKKSKKQLSLVLVGSPKSRWTGQNSHFYLLSHPPNSYVIGNIFNERKLVLEPLRVVKVKVKVKVTTKKFGKSLILPELLYDLRYC